MTSHRTEPATPDQLSGSRRPSAVKALGAVLAVALVPLALVVAPLAGHPAGTTAQPAAVTTPGLTATWLALRTGTTSSITLNTVDGQQGAAQTLAPAASCGVNLGPAASQLLTLRGSTGGAFERDCSRRTPAARSGSRRRRPAPRAPRSAPRASRSSSASARACAPPSAPTSVATSAYLDVELKGSARILATARQGTTVVGTFELQSGYSVGLPPVATTTPFVCTGRRGLRAGQRCQRQLPLADQRPVLAGRRRRHLLRHPHPLGPEGFVLGRGRCRRVGAAGGAPARRRAPRSSRSRPTRSPAAAPRRHDLAAGAKPEVTIHRLDNVGAAPCSAVPYTLSTEPTAPPAS